MTATEADLLATAEQFSFRVRMDILRTALDTVSAAR